MKDKKFRLLYFPESQSDMREIIISRNRLIFMAVAVICFLFVAMTGLGVLFSTYTGDERLAQLNTENQILKHQISAMGSRVKNIEMEINTIRTKDSELRLVSNLPDVEDMLKDAGIGGSEFQIDYNPDLISADADELIRSNLKTWINWKPASISRCKVMLSCRIRSILDSASSTIFPPYVRSKKDV